MEAGGRGEAQRPVEAIYDDMAEVFADHAAHGLYNAHLDRPAVLDLCADVRGLDVLDVGCGPGLYAAEILARGAATVTAFDGSAEMVRLASARLGDRATVFRHDASLPLADLAEDSFDLVVCALMIHYVDNRVGLYREIARVLRPGGAFVLSTQHPMADWLRHDGSYFDTEWVTETWRVGGGVDVHLWRMSLETLCGELGDAGFLIERLVEPRPAELGRDVDPEEFAKRLTSPAFIALRLVAR